MLKAGTGQDACLNMGRRGRSVSLAIKTSWSLGRPSRLKKPPLQHRDDAGACQATEEQHVRGDAC